jgi:hypothetical protein
VVALILFERVMSRLFAPPLSDAQRHRLYAGARIPRRAALRTIPPPRWPIRLDRAWAPIGHRFGAVGRAGR